MNYETLKSILETDNKIVFTLHSLEYTIIKEGNQVVIYNELYNSRKNYNNLDELMNTYTIYNESLITYIDILNIKKEEKN